MNAEPAAAGTVWRYRARLAGTDIHRLHGQVMAPFPAGTGRAEAAVLWRPEPGGVLVQSLAAPAGGVRPVRVPLPDTPGRYRFVLVGNPVRVENATKRRVWLDGDDAMAWLARKLEADGCRLDRVDVTGRGVFRGRRPRTGILVHRAVRFSGTLTCRDVGGLREMLVHGVGRARAYGCGLLTVEEAGDVPCTGTGRPRPG